jgi:hypothetical protein
MEQGAKFVMLGHYITSIKLDINKMLYKQQGDQDQEALI